jgi:hypothetical protein
MPLIIPVYVHQPDTYYAPTTFNDVFVWCGSGSQQLRRPPYSMTLSIEYYESAAKYAARAEPLLLITYEFTNPSDMAHVVYGKFPADWIVPECINPLTPVAQGATPVPEPLDALKKLTAFLVRNHPILGQEGAVWT